jgi:FKBP-type peptidyl-prolyl cis-trans isomerase SlyD
MMKGKIMSIVTAGATVAIEYTLTLDDETIIDTNVDGEPLSYSHGSRQIIPGLEQALEGLAAGDCKQVSIAPEQAYGTVNHDAIVEVAATELPPNAREVGAQIQAETHEGETIIGKITEVDGETATIDFNHPLAGQTLHFDVRILSVN